MLRIVSFSSFFFTIHSRSMINTLSLHDALPIYSYTREQKCRKYGEIRGDPTTHSVPGWQMGAQNRSPSPSLGATMKSEEHTSELQSRGHLVCRLLLETKKTKYTR